MRVALAVLFFVSVFGDAAASDEHRFYVSPFWGGSLMEARSVDDPAAILGFEGGPQLGVRSGYHLSRRISVEGTYRYSPKGVLSLRFRDFFADSNPLETETDSHAVTGDMRFFALDVGNVLRTFLVAGLGVEIFPGGPRTDSSFLWNVGGGAEWRLRPGLGLRGDVRYVGYPDFFLTEQREGGIELHGGIVISF